MIAGIKEFVGYKKLICGGSVLWERSATMQYASYDGVNDYTQIPNTNGLLNITGNATLEFEANSGVGGAETSNPINAATLTFNYMPSDKHIVCTFGSVAAAMSNEAFTVLGFSGAGAIYKYYQHPSGQPNILKNVWRHYAIVFTPTAWLLYIDGVITGVSFGAANNKTWFDLYGAPTSITIGKREYHNQYGLFKMRNVRIWKEALTVEKINLNRGKVLTNPETNLVLNLPLQTNSSDLSGNNLHGTNYNGVTYITQ